MVIDDALRIARRAGGVVQRDRVPFVRRVLPGVVRDRLRPGTPRSRSRPASCRPAQLGSSMSITSGFSSSSASAGSIVGGELAIGDQRARAAMAQHEGDASAASSRVFSVFSTAPHIGTPKCASYIGRDVRRHHRDRVVLADAAPRQRRGQPPAARIGLAPGEALRAVDDRGAVRIHIGRALEEGQRRQRRVVGLVPVEPGQIGAVAGHASLRSMRVSEHYARAPEPRESAAIPGRNRPGAARRWRAMPRPCPRIRCGRLPV